MIAYPTCHYHIAPEIGGNTMSFIPISRIEGPRPNAVTIGTIFNCAVVLKRIRINIGVTGDDHIPPGVGSNTTSMNLAESSCPQSVTVGGKLYSASATRNDDIFSTVGSYIITSIRACPEDFLGLERLPGQSQQRHDEHRCIKVPKHLYHQDVTNLSMLLYCQFRVSVIKSAILSEATNVSK